ncbi:MAG: hypothetical protein ACOY3I_08290 [Verrucomicrobiota bacterium]
MLITEIPKFVPEGEQYISLHRNDIPDSDDAYYELHIRQTQRDENGFRFSVIRSMELDGEDAEAISSRVAEKFGLSELPPQATFALSEFPEFQHTLWHEQAMKKNPRFYNRTIVPSKPPTKHRRK